MHEVKHFSLPPPTAASFAASERLSANRHGTGPEEVKILDTSVPGQPIALENLPQPRPAYFQTVPQLRPFYGAVEIVGIGVPSQTGTFAYNAATDGVELNWPAGAAHNVYQRFYDISSRERQRKGVHVAVAVAVDVHVHADDHVDTDVSRITSRPWLPASRSSK